MSRNEFKDKYYNVILGIYAANGKQDDTSVCTDKLISSIRGHFGESYKDGAGEHVFEEYPGIPKDFDWDAAYKDYKELIRG
ncbi:MAG: hypothetical protein PHE79_04705 [Eubacteriales bacterium]|nr:hypothetical protein [Eubacteriales bacterium]